MAAEKQQILNAGTLVTTKTEIEKPGVVLVQAFAPPTKAEDAKPVCGFFVRRRFHGQQFLLAKPEEFSANWMQFAETPPKEWIEKLRALGRIEAKADISEYMVPSGLSTKDQLIKEQTETFSVGELMLREKQSQTMNYSTGRVQR
jgi:hypothetical protein